MRRSLLAIVIVITLQPLATTSRAQDCGWQMVDAPDPGPVVSLNDVVTLSSTDAWAVGQWNNGGEFSSGSTLAVRWDGDSWATSPTPNRAGSRTHSLASVDASTPEDVWAVGWSAQVPERRLGSMGPPEPLIEHFDGSRWSIVPRKAIPYEYAVPTGVAAISPRDVWIVGTRSSGQGLQKSFVMHYDGRRWERVPSGNKPGRDQSLLDVNQVGRKGIWAVGERLPRNGGSHPLGLRFSRTGRESRPMPVPESAGSIYAAAVAGSDPGDVWATGWYHVDNGTEPFVEHFDGEGWQLVEPPEMGTGEPNEYKALLGVSAVSPDDVWAVGRGWNSDFSRSRATVAHWDGGTWDVEQMHDSAELTGVHMLAAGDGWAVGTDHLDHSESEPSFAPPSDGLILRYTCP